MAISEEFLVKVSVDSAGAVRSIQGVSKQFQGLSKSGSVAEKSTSLISKRFKEAAIAATGLNQSLELVRKAYRSVVDPARKVIDAFIVQEKAETKLINTMKVLGQFTQASISDFTNFASELQSVSTVGDETSLRLLSMAKSFGLTNKEAKSLVKTSADLSAATGRDIDGAFKTLLKTFTGTSTELKRLGFDTNQLTSEQMRMGAAVDLVAKRFKGLAAVETKTLVGSLKQLSNSWSDLLEDVGRLLSEFLNLPAAIGFLRKSVEEARKAVKSFSTAIFQLKTAFNEIDFNQIAASVKTLTVAFVGLFAAIKFGALIKFVAALGGLKTIADILPALQLFAATVKAGGIFAAAKAVTALGAAFALAAGKVVLIVSAVAAVAVAIDLVARNLSKLSDLANLVAASVTFALQKIAQGFLKLGEVISGWFSSLAEKLKNLGLVSESVFESIVGFQEKVTTQFENLGQAADETRESISTYADGLDLGLIGQGIKFVNGLFKEQKQIVGEIVEGQDQSKRTLELTSEQLKLINSLQQENIDISAEISAIGRGQIEQLQLGLEVDRLRIDARREQLRLEGNLTKEAEKQLDFQKELLDLRAQQQIEQMLNVQIINPNEIERLQNFAGKGLSNFASGLSNALSPMSNAVSAMTSSFGAILNAIQGAIDFVPQLLGQIAGIFESLTELPMKIVEGLDRVFQAVINFVTDFIPNLLNSISDILKSVIVFLIEGLPEAFMSLFDMLPQIITDLLDELPNLIEKLILGITTALPRIVMSLIDMLITHGPRIAMSIVKTATTELPKAIINGLIEGGKLLFKLLRSFFTGEKVQMPELNIGRELATLPDDISKGAQKLGKAIAKESSQLFQVMDLDEVMQPAETDQAIKAIEVANNIVAEKQRSLWQKMLDGLIGAWRWIWDKILEPIIMGLREVWLWVWNRVLWPIIDGIRRVFTWVWENVLNPILMGLKEVWLWVWGMFQKVVGLLADAFNFLFDGIAKVGTAIWDGIKRAVGLFLEVGSTIWSGLKSAVSTGISFFADLGSRIWGGLKDGLSKAGAFFSDIGSKIWAGLKNGLSSVGQFFKDSLIGILPGPLKKILGFFEGGIIPGRAATRGDSPLNDSVLIAASPGEGIIPRTAMEDPLVKSLFSGILNGTIRAANVTQSIASAITGLQFNQGGVVGTTTPSINIPRLQSPAVNVMGGGSGDTIVNNFDITMNLDIEASSQKLDDTYIRNTLIPAFKRELKSSSLRGELILSQRGVFA